nr:MAG TPA: hypothetical protein [Caudoviricetes sp.]
MNIDVSKVSYLFFHDLKSYNNTNFRTLYKSDLSNVTPDVIKAFSSVITRYFIFCEKHPELSDLELRMLYFQLKLDMIGRYFSNYPNTNNDDLIAFQTELKYYISDTKEDLNE